MNRILNVYIIEDDRIYSKLLFSYLSNLSKRLTGRDVSLNIVQCENGEEFLEIDNPDPDIIFLDYHLDSTEENALNGLQILKSINRSYPETQCVILTSQEHTITTVELMKNGAIDYIEKDNNSFHRVDLVVGKICVLRETKKKKKKLVSNLIWIGALIAFTYVVYTNK
ncbi:MAG: response regulator [Flavobacteriales bacterium]|nr:response regulator [Flavobacteriales bacterium]